MGFLPPWLRMTAMVGSLGLVAILGMALMRLPGGWGRTLFYTLLIAGAVLALLFACVAYFRKKRKQKREQQAGEAIVESATGQTAAVSEPDEIARLDQLRKEWQKAYATFREYNDDGLLARLPWILIAGEPGSGKTEAIRHSGIPFPAGLNKPQQGSGGTWNMDWWFANDAIIIDTAGRLMFSETREWSELLKQLGKARPHCPINGMVLVIPTDSLLKDSTEDIEKKADRIALQINTIRRELGIRFPVFVVITKCDYITGFREFFSAIDDPAYQHQILGWSNPDPIDQPFHSETVDQHIDAVSDRLRKRAMTMLLDPPQVDEYSDRRADQVDALYAFPQELLRIKSRLRLYMEKIFTPGPYTRKPPFVRGIYFTSSMQEGQEIDTALAELLNVSPDELPAGRVWQEDKAYFLKDLFMQKVFPEQGLVTRAVNATQQYRRNRLLVNGVSIAVLVLSVMWIAWGLWSLNESIGRQNEHWSVVADAVNSKAIPRYIDRQGDSWKVNDQNISYTDEHGRVLKAESVLDLLKTSAEFATDAKSIRPSGMFRLISRFVRARVDQRDVLDAHRLLVRHTVMNPLLVATREKIKSEENWAPYHGQDVSLATRALAELIRLEAVYDRDVSLAEFDANVLFDYVAVDGTSWSAEDSRWFRESLKVIQEIGEVNEFMREIGVGGEGQPNQGVVVAALERFDDFWKSQLGKQESEAFSALRTLSGKAKAFDDAERKLLALANGDQDNRKWSAAFARLKETRDDLSEKLKDRKSAFLIRDARDEAVAQAGLACHAGMDALFKARGMRRPVNGDGRLGGLGKDEDELEDGAVAAYGQFDGDDVYVSLLHFYECESPALDDEQERTWRELDAIVLAQGENRKRFFEKRFEMYRSVNELFQNDDADQFELGSFAERQNELNEQKESVLLIDDSSSAADGLVERMNGARKLVKTVAERAIGVRRQRLYDQALRIYANADIGRHVEDNAEEREIPRVPLSPVAMRAEENEQFRYFNRRFDPETASLIFDDWEAIEKGIGGPDQVTADWMDAKNAVTEYMDEYRRYWKDDVRDMVRVSAVDYDNWNDFHEAITKRTALWPNVVGALEDFAKVRSNALGKLDDTGDPPALDQDSLRRLAEVYDDYRPRLESIRGGASTGVVEYIAGIEQRTELQQYAPFNASTDGSDCIVEGFFGSLQSAKFGIIADEARRPIERAREELRETRLQRFPVVWDSHESSALSLDELRKIGNAVGHLAGSGSAHIESTVRTGIKEIDDQLAVIRGEDGFVGRSDRVVINRIRQIVDLLGSDTMTVTLVKWGDAAAPDDDGADSAVNRFQSFVIEQEARQILGAEPTDRPERAKINIDPQKPLRFRFSQRRAWAEWGDQEVVDSEEHRNWTLIRLLQQDKARPVKKSSASEDGYDTWLLPVYANHNGQDLVFWIKVQFESPLPSREKWPRKWDWPTFRQAR
ncbi:MAG: hypothetical protein EA377_08600 [Phycisphaerales bacterium]|nr:MAG: hypothetical protein EA377_08600 [Phycisphaerales bacterium]